MKALGPVAAACGALVISISLSGCTSKPVNAAPAALTQAEAEKLLDNVTLAGCNADRSQLRRTVRLGTPDPNTHIREKYGPVMTYPVMVTWTGSCVGKVMGRTDFYDSINAKYTAGYWRNDFGEWSSTPLVGTCRAQRVAYQVDGNPKFTIPNPPMDGCSLMDLRNQ